MEEHYKLSDIEFEEEFRSRKMDPSIFTHEAHLRLTWIHINKYGIESARNNIEDQIKSFVKHVGAEDKYHQTVTIAAVNAVNHFIKKSEAKNFENFILEHSTLKSDFKELLNSHYSFNIFNSEKAKVEYVEPDVQSFGE